MSVWISEWVTGDRELLCIYIYVRWISRVLKIWVSVNILKNTYNTKRCRRYPCTRSYPKLLEGFQGTHVPSDSVALESVHISQRMLMMIFLLTYSSSSSPSVYRHPQSSKFSFFCVGWDSIRCPRKFNVFPFLTLCLKKTPTLQHQNTQCPRQMSTFRN